MVPEVNILHETAEPARVHSTFVQNRLANEPVQGPPSNVPTDQPLHQVGFGSNNLDELTAVMKPTNDGLKGDPKGDSGGENKKVDPFSSLFDDDLLKDISQDKDFSKTKTDPVEPSMLSNAYGQPPSKVSSFVNNPSRAAAPLNPISKPSDEFQDSFLSEAPISR